TEEGLSIPLDAIGIHRFLRVPRAGHDVMGSERIPFEYGLAVGAEVRVIRFDVQLIVELAARFVGVREAAYVYAPREEITGAETLCNRRGEAPVHLIGLLLQLRLRAVDRRYESGLLILHVCSRGKGECRAPAEPRLQASLDGIVGECGAGLRDGGRVQVVAGTRMAVDEKTRRSATVSAPDISADVGCFVGAIARTDGAFDGAIRLRRDDVD